MMDTEVLAQELHDVAFAWNQNMPPWISLPHAQREWFRERAANIIHDTESVRSASDPAALFGAALRRVEEYYERCAQVRRTVKPSHASPVSFTSEQAAVAVRAVREEQARRDRKTTGVTPQSAGVSSLMRRVAGVIGYPAPYAHKRQSAHDAERAEFERRIESLRMERPTLRQRIVRALGIPPTYTPPPFSKDYHK